MDEGPKGFKAVKVPLILIAVMLAGMGVAFALFYWSPWDEPSARERELEWLAGYSAWLDGIELQLATGARLRSDDCGALEREIGAPPTPRLEPAARLAADGCARIAAAQEQGETAAGGAALAGWQELRRSVRSRIAQTRLTPFPTTQAPALARVAGATAGSSVTVRCWRPDVWALLVEDVGGIDPEAAVLNGFADVRERRIDLGAPACRPLRLFVNGTYAPVSNIESFELAKALSTLAHEAAHLADRRAPESVVQCDAVQAVRDLALDEGRPASYANELALLNWEVAYPQLPDAYRTPRCRNGGPLDRKPNSAVWP